MDVSIKVEVERERVVGGQLVDLGQDVDVGEVHLLHAATSRP